MNIQKRVLVIAGLLLIVVVAWDMYSYAGRKKQEVTNLPNYPETVEWIPGRYFVTDSITFANSFYGKTLAENEVMHVYLMDIHTNKLVGLVSASDYPVENDHLVLAKDSSWRPADLLVNGGLDYGIAVPPTGEYTYLFVQFEKMVKDRQIDYPKQSYDGTTYVGGTLRHQSGQVAENVKEIMMSNDTFKIENTIPRQEKG
jgi:hypothetical protein